MELFDLWIKFIESAHQQDREEDSLLKSLMRQQIESGLFQHYCQSPV